MSQTSIGRAALVLTTNGSGLRSGLDQEGRHVEKWAADTGKKVNAKLKDTAKPKAGAADGLGLAASLGRIAGPAAIAAAAIGTVKSAADTLQDLGRQGDMATALGLSSEQFTGLAGVFSRFQIDAQGTADVLTDVADWVQDAAVNGGELAETFGFMGVNAKQLMGLRPDQQFLAISDALSKLDPTLAAGLAARLGGDFQKLLPVLRQGSGAIQGMASGFAVSARDMETARGANQALTEAGSALSGAWRTVAVALAPVVTLIGKGIAAAVGLARPVLEAYAAYTSFVAGLIRRVWGGITDVISRVWDRIMQRAQPVFDWLNRAWATVQEIAEWAWEGVLSIVVPVVDQVVSLIEQAVDAVADWATELLGFTSQWPSFRDMAVMVFRAVGTAGAYAWDTLKAGAGALMIALGFVVKEGFSPLVGAFKELIGLSSAIPDSMRPAWVDSLNAAIADADGKVAGFGQTMQDTGRGWINGFGDSAVQFNAWLDRMLARQKNAAQQTAGETAKAVDSALKTVENKPLLKGSSAEITARLKHDYGTDTAPKQMVLQQKQTNKHLAGIEGAVKAGKKAPDVLLPM